MDPNIPNTNLSEAIKTIQDTAQQASTVRIESLVLKNAQNNIPVAFLADGPGKMRAQSVLAFILEAERAAEASRLAHAEGPDRRKGTARHQTLNSFTAHMNRFKDMHSVVWADACGSDRDELPKLVGILNYHHAEANGTPRWGDHRAEYPLTTSTAWDQWGGGEPKVFGQDELAEFLDAHDFDLTSGTLKSGTNAPTPAAVLTMANQLEVYSSVTASRSRDQNTGKVKISYNESKGLSGDVLPPPVFLIFIPVFEDSEKVLMEVRLRVKIDGGKAIFTVQIHDALAIWSAAFDSVCMKVINETALPVYQGTPE